MEIVVNGYAYALLTFSHAERACELYLVLQSVFSDEVLKLFNYLSGALEVAGAADTYCDFHVFDPFLIEEMYINVFLKVDILFVVHHVDP